MTARGEQVRERVVREQLVPMIREELEHRPGRQQMPRPRLPVQKLTLPIIATLHAAIF